MRIINNNLEKIGIYIRKSRGIPKAKKEVTRMSLFAYLFSSNNASLDRKLFGLTKASWVWFMQQVKNSKAKRSRCIFQAELDCHEMLSSTSSFEAKLEAPPFTSKPVWEIQFRAIGQYVKSTFSFLSLGTSKRSGCSNQSFNDGRL